MSHHTFRQDPELPNTARPIVFLGGGGIVRHGHIPAYRMMGLPMYGVYDVVPETAQDLARDFELPNVYSSLEEALSNPPENVIWDVAVPAASLPEILSALPEGAAVLIQKPFGEVLEQARALRQICRDKNFVAAVNFQLRWSPNVMVARDIIEQGLIGDVLDFEVYVNVNMPWHLWEWLKAAPRMEILYHSIHYVDLVRSFLGDPKGMYAKTVKHPNSPDLHSSRSSIIFDYGDWVRAVINTYHGHDYGPRHQQSFFKIEGTKGVIRGQLGLNLDYPNGRPDELEYCLQGSTKWVPVPLIGSWIPYAFRGTMAALQCHLEDRTKPLPTHFEDAYRTMAVVEAAYISSESGAVGVPD
ncbi:MAG: Gfo/Idh/MocA family oxidoreductase [Fimbriimonadaceae bacterium]|nr:Gfo/Idh/MocA family oxidoreductase [Fimbriimonadaceae bacterium]